MAGGAWYAKGLAPSGDSLAMRPTETHRDILTMPARTNNAMVVVECCHSHSTKRPSGAGPTAITVSRQRTRTMAIKPLMPQTLPNPSHPEIQMLLRNKQPHSAKGKLGAIRKAIENRGAGKRERTYEPPQVSDFFSNRSLNSYL